MKNKISAAIITNNEARNIKDLLLNISFVDEVIIVDSFSNDNTVPIAQSLGAKVFQKEFDGFGNQKNYAIDLTSHQWILLLDADERVSDELKKEIIKVLNSSINDKADAYYVKRDNYFLGKKINFSGWQNDKILRLIQKNKCRYNSNQVHESIISEGLKTATLDGKLMHYTYQNVAQFQAKQLNYAMIAAKELYEKNKKASYFYLIFKPIFRFIKHYFFQLGILDGKAGFMISLIMARTVYMRYIFLKKLNKDH